MPPKVVKTQDNSVVWIFSMIRMVVVDSVVGSVDDYIESLRWDHLRSLVAACIFLGLKNTHLFLGQQCLYLFWTKTMLFSRRINQLKI